MDRWRIIVNCIEFVFSIEKSSYSYFKCLGGIRMMQVVFVFVGESFNSSVNSSH